MYRANVTTTEARGIHNYERDGHMTFGLTLAAIALLGFMLAGCATIALCQAADEKPQQETKPMSKLMRVVQCEPGAGLDTAIRRAWMVAQEHGPTIAVHLNIPVVVSADSTQYEAEQRWRATARLYERRDVCNQGK